MERSWVALISDHPSLLLRAFPRLVFGIAVMEHAVHRPPCALGSHVDQEWHGKPCVGSQEFVVAYPGIVDARVSFVVGRTTHVQD